MYRVGTITTAYQSKDLLEKSLEPWLKIKENPKFYGFESLLISVVHGCFEETYSLGYPIESTDGTVEYLYGLSDGLHIDECYVYKTPQKEYDMWTHAYELIKNEIDILFMVNSDEIWTIEEIQKALRFVEEQNYITYFKVNFKNYCINDKTWVDNFTVPRIWYVNKEKGLKRFYKDDLVEYNSGKKDIQCSELIVPNVHPRHESWIGTREYLQRKVEFQKLRYGQCSYRWNKELDCLELNDDYYKNFNLMKPVLNND